MFGHKISLFSILGFKVSLDISWFVLAVLIVWSLAKGLFPYYFEGFSTATYWWMGAAGALGLFVSIIFHEFCHSLVARRFGLPMKGITLFIFGGVAEMESEPQSAKSELLMAIAGPVSSIFLGGLFFLMAAASRYSGIGAPVEATFLYLGWLNFILAAFNLIPAFPLDGGRVLRASLWAIKGNIRWATRIASKMGKGFGILLMLFGVYAFITGNFIGGIWYFLIGTFIRSASQSSYNQLIVQKLLSGEKVSSFMKSDPVTVPASASVQQLVDDFFYKYHYKMFPVINGSHLKGSITSKQVKAVPRQDWPNVRVENIMLPCDAFNTIGPYTDAIDALRIMNKSGNSRLMVVKGEMLLGIVTLKDMLKFLSLKMDLEGIDAPDLLARANDSQAGS